MLVFKIISVAFILNYNIIYSMDSCKSWNTCQDCLRDPALCIWCAMDDFEGTRCISQNSNINGWCPKKYIQNLTNFVHAPINENFSYNLEHVIQIKPQQYKMKLRPGKSADFNFSFLGARDYPVDLYFLLDASASMTYVKAMTANKSENIYNTIRNMTKNVHLGLGTFVDKRALPFTNTFDSEKTYSFRHRLPMTDNYTTFKETVIKTPNGLNQDTQEGGLDALAQVMTCKDLVGWRNDSRKIIILITDGPYHAAGDGRSAGIFQPYDGKCYSHNGSYTKELEMDYPSVGMISKLAAERNMIILFYVAYACEEVYRGLSGVVSGSRLSNYDNDEIVTTLKDIYEKISKKITLKVNVKSGQRKNIEISFKPNCISDDSGSECDVEIGKEKQFLGNVKILKYDGQDKLDVDIVIESIGEKLTLEIEVIKNCDCESPDKVEHNSPSCHGEKRLCGQCDCGENRYGDKCACVTSKKNNFNNNSTCISDGSNEICSGQGVCVCGSCICRPEYTGRYCDCSLINCPRGSGKLCSGDDHGTCMCGKCVCKPDWTGEACECLNTGCLNDGKICNNRGHCKCGVCICDPIPKWDARNLRDENCRMIANPERHNAQCRILENCAKCRRTSNEEDCNSCDDEIHTQIVQTLPKEFLNSSIWKVCNDLKVDIGCYSSFVYRYDDGNYTLKLVVEKDKNCAETYYALGGMAIVVVVLIGIATLIAWKLLTNARDRREYKQFINKNKQIAGTFNNPLYAPPSTTFNNPAFRKRSFR